jgi:hypothetical protein
MPKVGDQTFSVLGHQISTLKVGDPKSGAFGLQLLVPKVETQDFFANENFLEFFFWS